MKIPSRPVRIALASGAVVLVIGAAGAGVALAPADGVAAGSSSRERAATTAADGRTQPATEPAAGAVEPAPTEPAAGPAAKGPLVEQSEGGEGYEGPGTERLPNERPGGASGEHEGPGTDRTAAPAYRTVTPSSWRIVVPSATVYAVPGDTGTRTARISDRRADIAGTGRAATVGTADWVEVKVPGAATGWVVVTELEQL